MLLGTGGLKKAAASFFITGTFWTAGAPMSMAMACLQEMDRLDVLSHVNSLGTVLGEGLRASAEDAGFAVTVSGPPAIPFLTFDDDPDLYLNQAFCARMARRGIYLHPHHNWFISYGHKEADIDETLEEARAVFGELAAQR